MDPKTQMPDIKAEVNKIDDGKKKATGLLGGLFGGGGGGAAGGLGGLGGGAVGGGGLLATKVGMIALVVMGSAVAGGIGLAGYKMFGPGDADRTGGNLSLFEPKPQQTADADGAAPVNADGSSTSLDYMAQAAAKDRAADASASADGAPSDNTAGDPAKDAAAADAAQRAAAAKASSGGAINSGSGGGAVGSMNRGLTNVKKLGSLSGVTGGGATSASAGSSTNLGANLASAAKNGSSSGFSRGGPGAKASSARGVASRRGRGARSQARQVMGDQGGGRAGSSFAAGRTYDGSTAGGGGAIGPDGGEIGMGGVGDGTGAEPKAVAANSTGSTSEQEPPIPKEKHMVTPWEKAVSRAMMLTMLVAALAYAATKIPPSPYIKIIQYAIGVAIMAIGAYIGVLAGQIMSGPYGQKNQGMVVAAAALGVIVTGVGVMMGASKSENKTESIPLPEGQSGPPAPGNAGSNGLDLMGNPYILLGGGTAIVAAIGMMFGPKPKPVEIEEGQKNPDVRYEAKPNPVRYMI